MGLPRTVGDFVCILSVIAIEFLSRTSSKELPSKAAIALNPPCSKAHSTHAPTLHACAVVELRFMTERKKKKNDKLETTLLRVVVSYAYLVFSQLPNTETILHFFNIEKLQ